MGRFGTVKERFSTATWDLARLDDDDKERLCQSLLEEFGATDVQVNAKGEMMHTCVLPWHDSHKRAASLNYKKLVYSCFTCGSGGGLLWLIGSCRGDTSEQARSWLQDQTGTGPNERPLSSLIDEIDAIFGPKETARTPIPRISPSVLDPWLRIHPWVTEVRHVPEENVQRFKVGYGVIPVRVNDSWVRSHRIVFPHFWKGDLVGWQSRRLVKDGTPKYVSSPDFPKDQTLYNYNARAETAVAVESSFSVTRHAHHVDMEGTFGAKLTERQLRLLSVHRRVILWFDNDDAGWKATHQAAEKLTSYSEVFVVPSPWAADPGDMDDDTVDALIAAAVPYSSWRAPMELEAWHGV